MSNFISGDRSDGLVDLLFDAFSTRPMSDGRFSPNMYDEYGLVARHLRDVSARCLSFEVLESYPHDQTAILCFLAVEGQLYYLPSFMALCVEDISRADPYDAAILWRFRYCPFWSESVLAWRSEIVDGLTDPRVPQDLRQLPSEDLREWFSNGIDPSRHPWIARMNAEEKRAVCRFLEFIESERPAEYSRGGGGVPGGGLRWRDVSAAKAMLGDGPLWSRLGVAMAEAPALVETLESVARVHPGLLPRALVEGAISELC